MLLFHFRQADEYTDFMVSLSFNRKRLPFKGCIVIISTFCKSIPFCYGYQFGRIQLLPVMILHSEKHFIDEYDSTYLCYISNLLSNRQMHCSTSRGERKRIVLKGNDPVGFYIFFATRKSHTIPIEFPWYPILNLIEYSKDP